MRALVISGGGSKGAFAGGVAEYLIRDCGNTYDLFVGTSTGGMLSPLLASNNLDRAKEMYTSIQHKDIFAHSPFTMERENGRAKAKMSHTSIIRNLWEDRRTFGDSRYLRRYIGRKFTQEDFDCIRQLEREVIVTVANLTKQRVEYKSSRDYTYEDFCDWIWASSSVLPFMSLVSKEGSEYGDGGFGNLIPIRTAIDKGATEVDVIILRPENRDVNLPPIKNVFEVLTRTYDFMFQQIAKDDVTIGQLAAENKHVDMRFFFTPRLLTDDFFALDPQEMSQWWAEGHKVFQSQSPRIM